MELGLTPAQKKKAELIAAAKVKQQYAKVLAKEGMQSVRVGGKGGVSARDAPPSLPSRVQVGREEADDAVRAERRMAAAMADPDSDSDSDGDSESDSDAEDEAARAAARMRQAAREKDEAREERRARKAFERGSTGTERARAPKDGRRPLKGKPKIEGKAAVRALSPPRVEPREGNMRELKREAFGKRHSGRGAGQPRMGARMDVLLEKIRRFK